MRHMVEARGLADRIRIESAGTGSWHVGDRADPRSRKAAGVRGYALEGRAQQFTRRFFDRFDYVLVADSDNRDHLLRLASDDAARSKVHLLRDFDPASPKGSDVPDPYYGGTAGFEQVLDMIEEAGGRWLDRFEAELEPDRFRLQSSR